MSNMLLIRRNFMSFVSELSRWLSQETIDAILQQFGSTYGAQLIVATDAYLDSLSQTIASATTSLIDEDPMFICSLPLQGVTMPNRGLFTVGTTRFSMPCYYRADMQIEFGVSLDDVLDENTLMTSGVWGGNFPLLIVYGGVFRWHIASGGSIDSSVQLSSNTLYELKVANGYISVDGTENTKGTISFSDTRNLVLWGENAYSTQNSGAFRGTMTHVTITSAYFNFKYVPFIRNSVVGFLDIQDITNPSFLSPSAGTAIDRIF